MNVPKSVDDPSLLEHEPLRTSIALLGAVEGGSRSETEVVFSRFIDEMRRNVQAAQAIKIWAYLVFKDVLSDENALETVDGGEQLYRAFLKYQFLLSQSRPDGIERARGFQYHIFRRGLHAIKLNDRGANIQHSGDGRGSGGRSNGHGSKRSSRPHDVSGPKGRQVQHPEAGDIALSSITGHGIHSTVCSTANDKKEKKRKASSRKPPVITPSDTPEDNKQPSKIRVVADANTTFHRLKRIAPDLGSRSYDSVKFKRHKKDLTNRTDLNEERREDISISRRQSALTSFRTDEFVSLPSIPIIKGKRGVEFPPNRRKHTEAKNLKKLALQPMQASSNSRGPQKDLRATERLGRASMSALSGEPGAASTSTYDWRAEDLQSSTMRGSLVTDSKLTRQSIHVESKAQRKRTRIEFETGFVMSHESVSGDSHESLGPDIRTLRPPPRKVRDERLVPIGDEDSAVCGIPRGASSPKHLDQLLPDGVSNALALLQEEGGPDVDWTQDEGHDTDCDDLDGDDQDEVDDAQATTETSIPLMVTPKPPVPAPPRIWAQSRQEVCESFQYFRCYHGGVYSKDNIVKGYLLGAYAASRDTFCHSGKLIISHGGGKSECILDPRGGPKRFQTDQDQEATDKSVRALLKTYKDRRPIALLADDRYALFPYDLTVAKYTYVVLGLYWISHAWAECQPTRDGLGRIVRWKFAFQWCEGQGEPWWAPQQEVTDVTSDPSKPIPNSRMCPMKGSPHPSNSCGDSSIQCRNCQEWSLLIYTQGWMCLNPRCEVFWTIDGEEPKQLDYREEFLSLLPQKFERLPNLIPARVVGTQGGVTTTYAFSKGWHCAQCGRLSCRYKWEHWECPNCQFKYVIVGRVRSPKEFWHQRPPKGLMHSQIGKDSGILASRSEPVDLGPQKGFANRLTFILPHARGKIHLILGAPMLNRDADDIFQLYQQQANFGELKLRRYPLRNRYSNSSVALVRINAVRSARGLLLTNYFSQNSGEPYQYVGGSGHTIPLSGAPLCVRRALALIKERARLALRTDIPFNEVLSAAYMERQKMSFHSDDEKELGPVVASLSLGSTALMHFRPARVNMECPRGRSAYALTLVLRHGDVLVMEGEGVQKYYEHTVVPMNFRIAATARCIGSA